MGKLGVKQSLHQDGDIAAMKLRLFPGKIVLWATYITKAKLS